MNWIGVGILLAIGLWLGSLLIGLIEAVWPFLLGGTIIYFLVVGLKPILFPLAGTGYTKEEIKEMEDRLDALGIEDWQNYSEEELSKIIDEKEKVLNKNRH